MSTSRSRITRDTKLATRNRAGTAILKEATASGILKKRYRNAILSSSSRDTHSITIIGSPNSHSSREVTITTTRSSNSRSSNLNSRSLNSRSSNSHSSNSRSSNSRSSNLNSRSLNSRSSNSRSSSLNSRNTRETDHLRRAQVTKLIRLVKASLLVMTKVAKIHLW